MRMSKALSFLIIAGILCTAGYAARMPIPPGFPTADSTGIKGVGLTTADMDSMSGGDFTTSGATYDKKRISGMITINASNVTFTRCEIVSTGSFNVYIQSGTGTVFEDCTFIGASGCGGAMKGASCTMRRCDIYGCYDGVKTYSYTEFYDNYLVVVLLDIRQCFNQDICFFVQVHFLPHKK